MKRKERGFWEKLRRSFVCCFFCCDIGKNKKKTGADGALKYQNQGHIDEGTGKHDESRDDK
jgi:hypothetical protein